MNLYSACIRLAVWNVAKARAEVWSISDRDGNEKSLSELRDFAKRSFKKLAMDHHPDRGGDRDNFEEIQEAIDLVKVAEAKDFIDALEDEKKSSVVYFDPGSENCKSCSRWGDVLGMCITVTCSGFQEPQRRRFANIRGQTQFAAFLDDAQTGFAQ
jgi:DnaJ-class molecular chaperone